MNPAYIHLILNHIPVLGILFGVLLLITGLVERNDGLKRAALATLFLSALMAVPVYLTGEPAEEIVEELAGVSEPAIEAHEEFAVVALIGAGVLGVVALAAWWLLRRGRAAARHFVTAALALGIVAGGLFAWTANLGGKIRHSEIRADATAAPAAEHDEARHEPGDRR